MTTTARPKKSAAFRLFHMFHEVLIQEIHLYSESYLTQTARPVSGSREDDEDRLLTEIRAQFTAADLAEQLAEGAAFRFVHRDAALRVYEDIQEHLKDWENYTRNDLMRAQAPVEDLQRFEQLARYLHPQVLNQVRAKGSDLLLNSLFSRRISRFSKEQQAAVEERARGAPAATTQYRSVTESITQNLALNRGEKR